MTATKKPRWKIAHLIDRLPGQCWADLVSWVVDGRQIRNERGALPWRPIRDICLQSGDERCYCGKVRNPEFPGGAR